VKPWLLVIFLLSPLFAYAQPADNRAAPACGLSNVKFAVSTTQQKNPSATPDTGKALVYFIQDDTQFESRPRPTVRFGMDGSWIGATHSNSWFSFSVDPGLHHLCGGWQKNVVLFTTGVPTTAATHFTAEAGHTYYFLMKDKRNKLDGLSVRLTLLDSDEAPILMRKFALSVSHPEK
jgi:hypothetical protein